VIALELKASVSVDEAGTITGTAWPFGSPVSHRFLSSFRGFAWPARRISPAAMAGAATCKFA
jgi:hypothetical protein